MPRKTKIVSIVMLLTTLSVGMVTAGNIGENFEGGGIAFKGSGYFTFNPGQIFDTSQPGYYLNINIQPGIAFLIADYMELGVGSSFSYIREQVNKRNFFNSIELGVWTQLGMYIVPTPRLTSGIVFSIGPKIGMNWEHGKEQRLINYYKFTKLEDKISIYLNADFKAYFFVKERFAPYIGIEPGVQYRINTNPNTMDTTDQGTFLENLNFPIKLSLGVSLWTPNKDKSVARIKFEVAPIEE